MSKPVKGLIRKDLLDRFQGINSLAVVSLAGVGASTANMVRSRLLEKDIRLTVVKNALAKQAFRELGMEKAGELLEGPCAVAYGADSVVTVVRELLGLSKDAPALSVKAAYMEGASFGAEQIESLSKYPTHAEALGRLVACILSPGGKLGGCLLGPSGRIAALVKAIEERQKEDSQPQGAAA